MLKKLILTLYNNSLDFKERMKKTRIKLKETIVQIKFNLTRHTTIERNARIYNEISLPSLFL